MLTLTYDEELDDTSVPNPLADPPPFELGGTSETVSMVAISGMTVTLTLSGALTSNTRGDGELHARHKPCAGYGGQ